MGGGQVEGGQRKAPVSWDRGGSRRNETLCLESSSSLNTKTASAASRGRCFALGRGRGEATDGSPSDLEGWVHSPEVARKVKAAVLGAFPMPGELLLGERGMRRADFCSHTSKNAINMLSLNISHFNSIGHTAQHTEILIPLKNKNQKDKKGNEKILHLSVGDFLARSEGHVHQCLGPQEALG